MVRSRRTRFVLLLCFLVAWVLSVERARAQAGSQGSVIVTVTDVSGGVVGTASLTLVALRTNDIRTAQTEHNGTYTFVNLPIGTYSLTVDASGYAKKVYDAVLVQASQSTSVTATLAVGSTNDTVRVSAETAPVLETSSNEIGTVVDIKQIEDLPLNGRDLTSFSQLVAGYNLQRLAFDGSGLKYRRRHGQLKPHEIHRERAARSLAAPGRHRTDDSRDRPTQPELGFWAVEHADQFRVAPGQQSVSWASV